MAESGVARSFYAPRVEQLPPERIIFGRSAAMLAVRQKVERIASTSVPVLIQGESGTGKGVLARYIHERSGEVSRPFIKVNCAAIPGTLLESELFGYEKGAFTGAYATKPGRAEQAEGGTLFLDGIDEIDRSLQAKLLQLLQDGQFSRIGGQEDRRVSVRVLCATHRPLEREIEAGRFRQDLFYRINVVNLRLPVLSARRDDILELAHYFLELHQLRHNSQVRPFSSTLLQLFARHPWPGNIRELENLVERYVILDSEDAVTSELMHWEQTHLTSELPTDGPIHLKKITRQAVHELEKKIILRVLEASRWNRKRAAMELKISYRALLYKIRQAGLPPKRSMRRKAGPAVDARSTGTDGSLND
jgi:two-component system, NtrC family, response regulator AtoC